MAIVRQSTEQEGITVFDSTLDHRSSYDSAHLEALMKAEPFHFWFSARRDKICQTFERFISKDSLILEIGGGTGFIAESLTALGFSVEMADIHLNGLRFAQKRGIKKIYQFDLFFPPFREGYDVICLFDVLEHLEDDNQAIECIKMMLKPGGKLILTVPAHQWLWSRDDVIAGHKRRYTKKRLEALFLASQLQTLHMRPFFISILPLLLLRTWIKKDSGTTLRNDECAEFSLNPILNRIFRLMMKAEFLIDRAIPCSVGGSLLAIAQKASPTQC